jgi:hypothetical protein
MKLQESLKELIYEIAAIDSVMNSIKYKQIVIINYQGDEPGGTGIREIIPVAYGYTTAGNQVVRAYDLEGASHRAYKGEKPLPSWRYFLTNKILSYKPSGEVYNELPPGYNCNGDKSMSRVIIIAKCNDNSPTEEPPTPEQQTV